MNENSIQPQIDEINQKLDLVLHYVNQQRLKSEAIEDLITDVSIVGRDIFHDTVNELDNQNIELDIDEIMATKNIAGISVDVNEEGYMTNPSQWTEAIAKELAKEEDIELTDEHLKVAKYLREEHEKGTVLTIRKVGKSGLVDIKGLYKLFPGGPLKKSSKIAGIPKPTSCV